MKKLLSVMAVVFLFLFSLAASPIDGETKSIETKTVKSSKEKEINRVMEIGNPYAELSQKCRVSKDGKTGYMEITSIKSYNAPDIWMDLKVLREMNVKKLLIYMNSGGGEASTGMGIADELRIAKKSMDITIEARGMIASAAVPIFLVADKRIASRSTIFMMHPAALFKWGAFVEELKDLQSQAKMISLLNDNYADIVYENSKLSKEEVMEILTSMTKWYTAEQAKEIGFVDEII